MAAYFLETSALVKRYVRETGTAWVQTLTEPAAGNLLYIAQITGVETVAAVTLRARRGNTSEASAIVAISDFRRDYRHDYTGVQILSSVIFSAMDLVEKHGLRGYDAVQLAAALQVHTERLSAGVSGLIFVSADDTLNAAATVEGLTVVNPNLYP